MDTEKMDKVLDVFRRLPPPKSERRTIMQLSGYPHWENVASNILEFYFSPEGEHGFGSIPLDSLVLLAYPTFQIPRWTEVEVTREPATAGRKRMDLLIETDAVLVGIENKVSQWVYNPLREYMKFLTSESNGRKVLPILLTLHEVPGTTDLADFKVVTYDRFFEAVLQRIPERLRFVDSQYLAHFVDFARTILSLERGTEMDRHVFEFIRHREGDINALLEDLKVLRDEMVRKVRELGTIMEVGMLQGPYNISQRPYTERYRLREVLVHDVAVEDGLVLAVDTALYPSGWRIELFARKGHTQHLEEWLRQHKISFRADDKWKGQLLCDDSFGYDADLAAVRDKLVVLIRQIESQGAPND
jgi:PD-(D/E)XK nuclease superfamily